MKLSRILGNLFGYGKPAGRRRKGIALPATPYRVETAVRRPEITRCTTMDRRHAITAIAAVPTFAIPANERKSFVDEYVPNEDVDTYATHLTEKWAVDSAKGVNANYIITGLTQEYKIVQHLRYRFGLGTPRKVNATCILAWQAVLLAAQYTKTGSLPMARQWANEAVTLGYQCGDMNAIGQGYTQIGIAEFWYGDAEIGRRAAVRGLQHTKSLNTTTRAMLQNQLMVNCAKFGYEEGAKAAERAVLESQDRLSVPAKHSAFNLSPDQIWNARGLAHEKMNTGHAANLFTAGEQAMAKRNADAIGFRRLMHFNVARAIAPSDPGTAVGEAVRTLTDIGRGRQHVDKIYRDRAASVLSAVPVGYPEERTEALRRLVSTDAA